MTRTLANGDYDLVRKNNIKIAFRTLFLNLGHMNAHSNIGDACCLCKNTIIKSSIRNSHKTSRVNLFLTHF